MQSVTSNAVANKLGIYPKIYKAKGVESINIADIRAFLGEKSFIIYYSCIYLQDNFAIYIVRQDGTLITIREYLNLQLAENNGVVTPISQVLQSIEYNCFTCYPLLNY